MTKDLSIVAIDFATHELTAIAIERTLRCIDPKEIIVISDRNLYPGATWVPCKPVRNYLQYNELMLKWTYPLVDTAHALYVQYDGFAVNKDCWTDDFLKYDYIGAIWPHIPETHNVGNGGFSLRSKRLLEACRDPVIQITNDKEWVANEDHLIGATHRRLLEHKYLVKFAPPNVAKKFSYETGEMSVKTFGVHGLHNLVYYADDEHYNKVIDLLRYNDWGKDKWINFLFALAMKGRFSRMIEILNKLLEHNSSYMPEIYKTLQEHAARHPNIQKLSQLIVKND